MADQVITLTIPDAKVQTALQGYLKIYPNNETVSEEDSTPKYTDAQWVNEKMKRLFVRDVKRGLQMIRNETVSQIEDTSGIAI